MYVKVAAHHLRLREEEEEAVVVEEEVEGLHWLVVNCCLVLLGR